MHVHLVKDRQENRHGPGEDGSTKTPPEKVISSFFFPVRFGPKDKPKDKPPNDPGRADFKGPHFPTLSRNGEVLPTGPGEDGSTKTPPEKVISVDIAYTFYACAFGQRPSRKQAWICPAELRFRLRQVHACRLVRCCR